MSSVAAASSSALPSQYSAVMAKFSLGSLNIDAEHLSCVRIDAWRCGVSDEDAVSLGQMMMAGHFASLKTLSLVRDSEH